MTVSLSQLESWLGACENEKLEFKAASHNYDFEKLAKYCCALANERGGYMILGVTNDSPHRVIGTSVFPDPAKVAVNLTQRLHVRVTATQLNHPNGRVLVFEVASRQLGIPVESSGSYWMREGESLIALYGKRLRDIINELTPDFSAEICVKASLNDLDEECTLAFRRLWIRKSGNLALEHLPLAELLTDAELLIDGQLTYAALILLGASKALGKLGLGQSEIIFEYRSSESSVAHQFRHELRCGFMASIDKIWDLINLRNEVQQFQDGLFIGEIATFNELAIREGLLNAVCHRNYQLPGSIFVRQYPKTLEIVSPGGFPDGVTPENILYRQSPRNRRVAEICSKCGLVERSGQGMNRIVESCIRESKPQPDFTGTDEYQVSLTLNGQIQDPRFIRFLEAIGQEILASFTTGDFMLVDCVHKELAIPDSLMSRVPVLVKSGILEKVGRKRYMLSRRFHAFLGEKGTYTRKKGLDHGTNKELLLKHIKDSGIKGAPLRDLSQVLPMLSTRQVQLLLAELRSDKLVHIRGVRSLARWVFGPDL